MAKKKLETFLRVSDYAYKKSIYPLARSLERFFIFRVMKNLKTVSPQLNSFNICGVPQGITSENVLAPIIVYPPTTKTTKEPNSFYEKNRDFFPKSYDEQKMTVLPLENGYANAIGTIIDDKGELVKEHSIQYGLENILDHRIFRLRFKNFFHKASIFPNTVACLTMDKQGNLAHWFFDVLVRLHLIEKSGFKPEKVYVKIDHEFQRESLHLLGYSDDKIIDAKEHPLLKAKMLLSATTPCSPGFPNKWMASFFREKLLNQIDAYLKENPINTKKIYVSRSKTSRRQVYKENELIKMLEPLGFKTIYPEEMSFIESCAYFKQADVIIAPHGAALTRLVFCNPNTKVVEFLPYKKETVFYWHLCNAIGLDYYYAMTKTEDLNPHKFIKGHRSCFVLDLEEIEETLKLAQIK